MRAAAVVASLCLGQTFLGAFGYRVHIHDDIFNEGQQVSDAVQTRGADILGTCTEDACANTPDECSKPGCESCPACNLPTSPDFGTVVTWELPESMLEVGHSCKDSHGLVEVSHSWTLGEQLGRGNNGVINAVRRSAGFSSFCKKSDIGKRDDCFAMKQGLNQGAQDEINLETVVMGVITCPGILSVVDSKPCTSKGDPVFGAYVMPMMIPDMYKWYAKASWDDKKKCRDKIQKGVSDALICMGKKSIVVHGDFKGDQVLYNGLDAAGCPKGLTISDFGLARQAGREGPTFGAQYYKTSGHLYSALFDGPKYPPSDPLGLAVQGKPGYIIVDARVDWCAFLFEMAYWLMGQDDAWFQTVQVPAEYRRMDCGWMGPSRKLRIVAPWIS